MTKPHDIGEIRTPVSVIARCSCGWSHTETRRQNARARDAKLQTAKRKHIKMVQQMTTPTDYPYIRAWDRLMHSNAGWTEVQLQRARQENAPPTAIYRTIEGVWSTFEQIESAHTKTLIERFVSERG